MFAIQNIEMEQDKKKKEYILTVSLDESRRAPETEVNKAFMQHALNPRISKLIIEDVNGVVEELIFVNNKGY